MNLTVGPKGADIMEGAGFDDVSCHGVSHLTRGGTPEVRWSRESVVPADMADRAYAPERAMDL